MNDFRITISQPKLSTGVTKRSLVLGSESSRRHSSIGTPIDHSWDLKAKSFQLNMNVNQYLVSNTAATAGLEEAKMVSQSSQTPAPKHYLAQENELLNSKLDTEKTMQRESVLFKLPPLIERAKILEQEEHSGS